MAETPSQEAVFNYLSNLKAPLELLGLAALCNPLLDKVSAQRSKMWSDHYPQAQIIHGAEPPRIFTGYETIIGRYEHDTTERDQAIQIEEDIPKFNIETGMYPLKVNPSWTVVYRGTQDNKVGYFQLNKHTVRSSEYGYPNKWMNIPQLNKGNVIPQNMKLTTSPAHRGNNMYMLGTNLKIAFMSIPQVTKDAFVISESAAKKLTSDGYEKISFKILPNQIPLDLYGNEDEYKFFPDIGEYVHDDGIICALRAPTAETFISDMTHENLTKVQPLHDTIFYAPKGAQIVDVDVVINRKCKTKTPKEIFTQVQKYRDQINSYCIQVWEAYQNVCKQNLEITPAFNSLVTRCVSSLLADNVRIPGYTKRADITLIKKKEPIEFIYLTLTYKYEHNTQRGFKLTNCQGGKGTISSIWPDQNMPRDIYGNVADIIADEGSIFNRMNPATWYSQYITFSMGVISQRVRELIEKTPGAIDQAYDYVMGFLNDLNPNYVVLLNKRYNGTLVGRKTFVEDVIREGLYLNLLPFTEGITPEKMLYIEEKYDIKKSPVTFGVKQRDGSIKFITTKKPVLIGDQYTFLLYKMPHQRCSGLSYVNQYRTPIRPSALSKLQFPFAQTPIKLGEDEIRNLEMVAGPECPARILGMYANSAPAVNMLAEDLLFSVDPAQIYKIDMDTEDIVKTNAIVGVAQHIFSCFGVSIATNTARLDVNPYDQIELPTDVTSPSTSRSRKKEDE